MRQRHAAAAGAASGVRLDEGRAFLIVVERGEVDRRELPFAEGDAGGVREAVEDAADDREHADPDGRVSDAPGHPGSRAVSMSGLGLGHAQPL
ncbi:MAG: hypothetical protein EHM55_03825 [Acidobacteria bacterium]|nr:MAG: hypothetical protein EHM55_03825 [Acidobacteriota bacterium]